MAKKVQTPEEVQAAIEKKVAKRTLFFGTFKKALAYFLAILFTISLVQIAFTPRTAGVVASTETKKEEDKQVDLSAGEDTVAEGETVTLESGETVVGLSKADAVKLINDATAAAANAGYDWERKCYYKDPIDVGSATGTINSAIHMVDENASLDSVVGGFLDITGEGAPLSAKKVKGSNTAPEGMKDKFLLKGMSLTESDVAQFVQSGNTYKFQISTCSNPQKDGGNALNHATNDFITQTEVSDGIKEALGGRDIITVNSADVQFSEIVIAAEIKDGKLVSLTINYLMEVKSLKLKVLVANVEGIGSGKVEETYKNFVY